MAERQQFFAEAAQDGQDELLGELDELEALAMEEELNQMSAGVGVGAISAPAQAQPAAAQAAPTSTAA